LEPWDFRYYMNLAKEKDYAVDQQKLKKYFPLKAVKSGVLRLYQHLLGLTFAQVETTNVWHPDVEMYSVTDADSNTLLGYFYLDLHPREGKYSHAAVFDLQMSCLRQISGASGECENNVEHQVAVSAMVANFTGPGTEQEPAYLLHDEVETFFHEFGHLMHQICARSELALFSGTRVETDFVECPSQMLENWVWTEEGLKALLGDNLTSSMPKDEMDKLLKSRNANAGTFYARQLLLAAFDQAIHTNRWKDDPQEVFVELSRRIVEIDPTPGTCMPASFQHLASGYDARYYGYMVSYSVWSLVYSADLYESRFRHAPDGGCLSPTVGREYREKILKPGGTKDAIDMLRDFLGREPNKKAFFKLLGVEA
uniref:Peptidase_M3 domain-containing protein n=1 Tax=Echinostoma caproni TaxID=27848 RepID=A0A183AL25_9TREM